MTTPRAERRVEIADGLHIPYVERSGSGDQALLLLHGATDSWRSFEPLLDALPSGPRVLAITQRGHGDADKPDDGYDVDTLAADALGFLGALGVERAVVVGHSLGGMVALRMAATQPDRVAAVGLISSFASLHDNPVVAGMWEEVVASLEDPVDPDFIAGFQQSTLEGPVPEGFFDTVVAETAKVPARVWRALFGSFRQANLCDGLVGVRAPVCAWWGDADALADEAEQRRLASHLPQLERITHAGGGHALHWEDPARVATELTAWLASLRSR